MRSLLILISIVALNLSSYGQLQNDFPFYLKKLRVAHKGHLVDFDSIVFIADTTTPSLSTYARGKYFFSEDRLVSGVHIENSVKRTFLSEYKGQEHHLHAFRTIRRKP